MSTENQESETATFEEQIEAAFIELLPEFSFIECFEKSTGEWETAMLKPANEMDAIEVRICFSREMLDEVVRRSPHAVKYIQHEFDIAVKLAH